MLNYFAKFEQCVTDASDLYFLDYLDVTSKTPHPPVITYHHN